jgi:DNA processing protein
MRIEVRSVLDADYPRRLLMISDPPPLLYISGTLSSSDDLAVAVVGARRGTAAGRLVTERFAAGLAEAGFTIVSGLARGVDAAAHRGALAAGGRTVAVLGCGLRRTYPPEHRRLREEIVQHGAVVSELSLDAPPHSGHFPRRNRIISGLSYGVIVTEAAIDSGSLITARLAADQGREVFAIPGSVNEETSRGTHALIKEGATLVEQPHDVIDVIAPQLEPAMRSRLSAGHSPLRSVDPFGNHERLVYDALSHEPLTVDSLLERTRLPVPSVMASLLSLELRRCVRQLPGQRYLRV